jgi:hypothetical protein
LRACRHPPPGRALDVTRPPLRSVELRPCAGNSRKNRTCLPSPPWGRGWTAAGAFSSRGGPGEGVKAVPPCADLAQRVHVSAHPLTPVPLPQGGEGGVVRWKGGGKAFGFQIPAPPRLCGEKEGLFHSFGSRGKAHPAEWDPLRAVPAGAGLRGLHPLPFFPTVCFGRAVVAPTFGRLAFARCHLVLTLRLAQGRL